MSQSYQSARIFSNDREQEAHVQSARCRYQVWISNGEVSLFGPGVREVCDEGEMIPNLDNFDSFEDFAIYIVLLFENGLWPEE